MQSRRLFWSLLACLAMSGSIARAEDPGLQPGADAPDFELKDQAGKAVKLSDLLKKHDVALVFYRSADW